MYEDLLFELKSEHVFSMPGFKHVAMEKKYTQYLLSDLENKWFSKNSAAQAADPLAAPKTAAKAKKDFFPGDSGYKTDWQVLAETRETIILWAKHNADSPPDKHIPT
jgi:hypothetical protein